MISSRDRLRGSSQTTGALVHDDWLLPEWGATGVGALMTTRLGGCSAAPFDSMNLRSGIGDDGLAVARNQALLAAAIGAVPVLLHQVHGSGVVRVHLSDAASGAPLHTADASVTTDAGIALTVQVADCLPVLFAAPGGRAIGAAHAGWRGLATGVLESTLAAVCDAAACDPEEVHIWLGACIGPSAFEVGADVLQAFGAHANESAVPGFEPQCQPAGEAEAVERRKWLADLPWLARQCLRGAGARPDFIAGGVWCTASDPSRFFSFRRDGITGRMAACIWIEPGGRGDGIDRIGRPTF